MQYKENDLVSLSLSEAKPWKQPGNRQDVSAARVSHQSLSLHRRSPPSQLLLLCEPMGREGRDCSRGLERQGSLCHLQGCLEKMPLVEISTGSRMEQPHSS